MSNDLPGWLINERRSVEAEIHAAFAGVSREGGVSWTESRVIDGEPGPRTPDEARAQDKEGSWQELIEDPGWNLECGVGGFNFLDAIGYRYYLAPAMVRAMRGDETGNISFALYFHPPAHADANSFRAERVSLITSAQGRAVARFL